MLPFDQSEYRVVSREFIMRPAIFAVALLLSTALASAQVTWGTPEISFGPTTYVKEADHNFEQVESFSASKEAIYTMKFESTLQSLGDFGESRITINNEVLLDAAELATSGTTYYACPLKKQNVMNIKLRAASFGTFTVTIFSPIPEIRATKSGSDVKIDIVTLGVTPYDYLKSIHPSMALRTTFIASGTTAITVLDTGTLNDGKQLVCYVVSDANKPAITMTTPANPTTTTAPKILVQGAQTGATNIYVQTAPATIAGSTYTTSSVSTPTVPLVPGAQTIVAAGTDPNGNTALAQASVTKSSLNTKPTIAISAPSGTIYTKRPAMQVTYSDPDAAPYDLDLTTLQIIVNGENWTDKPGAGPHASPWIYTAQLNDGLQEGANFITATIRDKHGYAVVASATFMISPPVITVIISGTSFTGSNTTLFGTGFAPTLSDNQIQVGSTLIVPASGSTSQLVFPLPAGTRGGQTTVTVDGMTSNNVALLYADAIVNAAMNSCHLSPSTGRIFYTLPQPASNPGLWELITPGAPNTSILRQLLNAPKGFDYAGAELFFGLVNNSPSGSVWSFDQGSNSAHLIANTLYGPQAASNVAGIARDVDGSFYTADNYNSQLKKLDPSLVVSILQTQAFGPLKLDPVTNTLYAIGSGGIVKMGTAPNAPITTVASNGATNVDFLPTDPTPAFVGALITGGFSSSSVIILGATPATNRSFDFYNQGGYLSLKTESASRCRAIIGSTLDGRIYEPTPPPIRLVGLSGSGSPLPIDAFPTKVYADFNPATGAASPNLQYIDVQVSLTPQGIMPTGDTLAEIEWEFEDPDDPTAFDIDGSPAGNDNYGVWDYPDRWQQLTQGSTVYTLRRFTATRAWTSIVAGGSRVRFHVQDAPGDNYRIRATLRSCPFFGDVVSSWSPVFTVWRKLHVEVDQMADADNYLDDQASTEPDTPLTSAQMAPDLTMLNAVYLPAYLEPVRDTGKDTPNVPFKAKIAWGNDMVDTARTARGTPANDGYWAAYLLGAFEVADDDVFHFSDNDPDGEQRPAGHATSYPTGLTNDQDACGPAHEFYSFIFNEEILDVSAQNDFDIGFLQAVGPPHEIGHQFKLPDFVCPGNPPTCDGTKGIMEIPGPQLRPVFIPEDLKTIRKTLYPHCGL